MVHADHQPHEMRHDDADEADRAGERDGGAVASDALTNASRCVRPTSTPRADAASAPTLSRFSDEGSHAKIANAISDHRQRGHDRLEAADVEVAHQPARGAIDLREVGDVLHEQDQRREERVQRHAGQQQHRRRHRAVLHRRQPIDDGGGDGRAGEAGQRHGRERSRAHDRAEHDGEHRAERRAGRDAERERRGQRIAQQRLEHDAGRGQRRADERARQDARHPRDEEDLRVDVVG